MTQVMRIDFNQTSLQSSLPQDTQFRITGGCLIEFGTKWTWKSGGCHKRQKARAPTPQAPIRNRPSRKVAKAKDRNRYTNLTYM